MSINSKFKESLSSLNEQQLQAVKQIDGPVLVLAGPGTGKTQLLTTRVGYILEHSDASPENILCLTFSETAARNMKQRLISIIGQAAYSVTISTYHSFGSDLIRRYPDIAENRELIAGDQLALDKIVRDVCDELDYANPLKADFYLKDIKTLISSYKRALITPEKLMAVCQSNETFMKLAEPLINDSLTPGVRMSSKLLSAYQELLENSHQLSAPAPEGITPLKDIWIEELEQACTSAQETGKTPTLTEWKNKWLEVDHRHRFIVKSPAITNRQRSLAEVYERYNQQLAKNGLFDYDDMILQAINTLESNIDLKLTLQERYQYILLDEFQDTNESQLKLVELLSDNVVNENRPNILAVGDDDQAIYSFQGAHYSHMQRFYEQYRDVTLISLVQNYRSTQRIIDFSAKIRKQIVGALTISDKNQQSAGEPTEEKIQRVELPLDPEHLAWTAQYVRQLIDQGQDPEEIAILTPKHKLLKAIIPYLHDQKIALSYDQRDNVLEDEYIVQLLTAAKLVISMNKHSAECNSLWPQILSYDYWQIPPSLIWQISWRASASKENWTEIILSEPRTRPVAIFFIKLSQIADYASYELMLNYLIGSLELSINETDIKTITSPFYQYHFTKLLSKNGDAITAREWRLLGHLSILRSKASESSEEGLNLAQFVDYCEGHNLAGLKIVDSSPFQESTKAVKLMTAYASKGQEFKTVILLNVYDEEWGKSSRANNSKIALPANLKYVKIDSNSDDEKLRLLYVALSRAEQQLILVSYRNYTNGKPTTPLCYLNETEANDQLFSPLLGKKYAQVYRPNYSAKALNLTTPSWHDKHLDNFEPERLALLKDRLINFKLSATKLNKYSDVSRGGPHQFYLDHILMFPSAPTKSSIFGSAIHGTLDWQLKEETKQHHPPKIEAVLAEFSRQLSSARLTPHDHDLLLNRGKACLIPFLKDSGLKNNPDDLGEEKFDLMIGNTQLSGEIDRLVIDKTNKTIHIIDFKTGSNYDKWATDIKSYHHKRQLYFYKLLVESSAKFKGYDVSGGTIYFVEPDKDDHQIKSLSLNFNQSESEKLVGLIMAVWNKIMALDFPDTSDYSDSLKAIRQFEKSLTEIPDKTELTNH